MKTYFTLILLIFVAIKSANSQIKAFIDDYNIAYKTGFRNDHIDELFKRHRDVLFWYYRDDQVSTTLQATTVVPFPLEDFKSKPLYQESIDLLLADTSQQKAILGSFLVCATRDTSRINSLKLLLKDNDYRYAWTAVHHILLTPKEIDIILDFINHNQEVEGMHYFLFFLRMLDPTVLYEFGTKNLYNDNELYQGLAIHTLKHPPFDPKKDSLIREAISKLPLHKKGWAISLAAHFKMDNMLTAVKPYLDKDTLALKKISLEALAASPSVEDGLYLYHRCLQEDSLSGTYLPLLLYSPQPSNVQNALELIQNKPLVADLYISSHELNLLKQDQFLPQIHAILDRVTNERVIVSLIQLIDNRFDDRSTQLLLDFLNEGSEYIRQTAASSIRNNPSTVYKKQLSSLATDDQKLNFALVDNLIYLNIDTLQSFYENAYYAKIPNVSQWDRLQSFRYLGTYPLQRHITLFREVLRTTDNDDFGRWRQAATALGKLKDTESVDLIIAASNREREASDNNCLHYIYALEMIKNDKAKEEIQSFEHSQDEMIRRAAQKILANW